jgi:hypothetical protein
MLEFGEFFHDDKFPYVFGVFCDLSLLDEFDCNDAVLVESVAFVDRAEVAFSEGLGCVDKKVVVELSHFLHF